MGTHTAASAGLEGDSPGSYRQRGGGWTQSGVESRSRLQLSLPNCRSQGGGGG